MRICNGISRALGRHHGNGGRGNFLVGTVAAVACVFASATLPTAPVHAADGPSATITVKSKGQVDKMWRLDCGEVAKGDIAMFSDTGLYDGQQRELVVSCYLIKHGDTYMLWDAGFGREMMPKPGGAPAPYSLKTTIVDQMAKLGLKPSQVTYLGISHYHLDHVGQAADFPQATLLIGKGDYEALKDGSQPMADRAALAHWLKDGKVDPVRGDRDVFGDGSVVMVNLPGHTPGHHGLIVRLPKSGTFLLSGDLAHFREQFTNRGVPTFNTDRADTVASMDRFEQIAKNIGATAIVSHDPRDLPKLPTFPVPAE